MGYERRSYEFILRADSPVAHHSGTYGNSAVVMQRKVRNPKGGFTTVPIVTGDSMRNRMREAIALTLLDAVGLTARRSLTEAALRLLFNGGMVTGRGDASAVSLDAYREMAELIPSLALFGGCTDSRVVPGRLTVSDAVLMCAEEYERLPQWVRDYLDEEGVTLDGRRQHVEEVTRVRMDSTLDPGKRRLMPPETEVEVVRRLTAGEKAHEGDDAVARAESKSSMMPRSMETLVRGSLFYWSTSAVCYDELDVDTFHTSIAAFLADAWVGGKRGTGHGKLSAVTARQCLWRRPVDAVQAVDAGALGTAMGQLFRRHVEERAERIRSWLTKVDA
jgi:hypothetical protein